MEKKMRGYCGIGIYKNKWRVNTGTLIRSAWFLGANFAFTIGKRYKKQPGEVKLTRHFPVFNFENFADFKKALQKDCEIIFVELNENAVKLGNFVHPERAVYILGAEDKGIPTKVMKGYTIVQIPQAKKKGSLNVSTAGSIVLYDRYTKNRKRNESTCS